MIRIVETIGRYQLACYPNAGWVVFRLAPNGSIDTVVINGKLSDVIAKYMELIGQ